MQAQVISPSGADALLVQLFVSKEFMTNEMAKTLEVVRRIVHGGERPTLRFIVDAYAGRPHRQTPPRLRLKTSSQDAMLLIGRAGMTTVVLHLIIQHFSDTRRPFNELAMWEVYEELPPLCTSTRALFNMSLVHRTWTIPSQRALAIKVHAHGVAGIRRALVSSSVGPWTRELLFTCATDPDHDDGDDNFDGELPTCVLPYLTALMSKLPNVQLLFLPTYFDAYNFDIDGLMQPLLQALKGLERLKGLWLPYTPLFWRNSDGGLNPCLAEFCLILPELRSLEYLLLHHWSLPPRRPSRCISPRQIHLHLPKWKRFKYNTPLPPSMEITPPKTLRTISLKGFRNYNYPMQYIDWLLRPRHGYGPRNLFLGIEVERSGEQSRSGQTCDGMEFISSISPHLSGMTSLHLDILRDYNEDVTKPKSTLSGLLRGSLTLKRLILDLYNFKDLKSQLDLPSLPALEELYLGVWLGGADRDTGFFSELDITLPRTLRFELFPSLKTITVIGNIDDPSVDEAERTAAHGLLRSHLGRTKEFCATTGLRFAYSKRDFCMFKLST